MSRSVENVLFEIVDLSESLQLRYAVMGGIAVRVHGIPRPTFDVDLELTVTEQQLRSFFDLALSMGYTIGEPFQSGWRDMVGGMPIVKMRTFLDEGKGIDVDIFLNETPFQRSVMDRAMPVEFMQRNVNFVTPEDLILFKLLANRPRDIGDAADILFTQGLLDENYMRHWAELLGIVDRLETLLAAQ